MLNQAVGQSLIFAAGIAVFPIPIITVVLLLLTPKARSNSLAFLGGWLAGIALVGALALAIITPYENYIQEQSGSGDVWIKLILGAALIYLGIKKIIKQFSPKGDNDQPKWMAAINSFKPAKSAGIGFALSGLNPKNILLIIAGATLVAEVGLSLAQTATAWLVFTLVATLGVGIPVVIFFVLGKRADPILQKLKSWMEANSNGMMAVILLLIGAMMLGDALAG